jgi:hypothetical protein
MKMRSAKGVVIVVAALAVIPAGVAVAQPSQPAANSALIASANAAAAVRAAQRISLTGLHLVSGAVRASSGRGVGGVCVLAVGTDGFVRMARTSATGNYEMSLPRAGAYAVQYRDCGPGKASVAVTARRQVQVGANPITVLPATILGRPGKAAHDGLLATPAVITPKHRRIILARPGEVIENGQARQATDGKMSWAVITGRVTDPSGRPLAGICMWIVGKTFAAGTSTNKHGTYRFEIAGGGIPGHSYPVEFDSMCATANPFVPIAPGRWAPEWYKDKFSQSKATKVALRLGKTARGINAVMQRGGEVLGAISGSDHRQLKHACAFLTDSSGQEFGQAFTNAKGQYTITGLESGSYRLVGVGACTGGMSDYAQTWYPHAGSIKKARVIKVRRGHRTSGINVVLEKLGTITGLVRLRGKTGEPLRGICVDVFSPTNPNDSGFATSGKGGKYVVEGLPADSYEVQASASGCGNLGNYAPAQYPHAVHVADARTTPGINLYMQPGGTLTGTVTDAATAKPLAGICVSDGAFDFAVSGKNGRYKIDQLPAERTTVGFSGGCRNAGSYAPQYYDDQVAKEAAQQVTVTAGQVTGGINAAMLPGATIAGRVTNSDGRPVSEVCLAILPADLSGYGIFGGDTWTNAAGSYAEANLAPGDYAVAFFSGCLGPSNASVTQWFKGQPAEAAAGLVEAGAGAEVSGIDAVVGRGGAIAGTVTSTAGQPIDFDCITAINRRTGQPSGFQSLSGSGTYTVSSLAPGKYTVVAADCLLGDNFAPIVYRRAVTVRAGVTTTNVALTLPPGGAVAGRITMANNGGPVRGACVEATPVSAAAANLGFASLALTSNSGKYKILGLRSGSYHIAVYPSCAGSAVNLQAVTLPHAVRVTQGKVKVGINASLHVGGSIAGLVTGPGAAAVPGACAEAYQSPGGPAAVTTADAHGKFVVTGLTPGKYKVEFGDPSCSDSAPGLGTQWYYRAADSGSAKVITVKAGRTASAINGVLPADGAITGSVTRTSAAPLNGVCVSAVPVAKGESAVFTVSADARYTLADLLPGRYRVEFQAGCGQAGIKTQWWKNAGSSATAKIITVSPGDTVKGVDAVMTNS